MEIKRISDLSQSGHYWWRATPTQSWQILYIANPERLTYGIAGFEFAGPIPQPDNLNGSH
jgi:hypothetical protein